MKAREVQNTSFARFCDEKNYDPPTKYRQVTPNLDASYTAFKKYDRPQPTVDSEAFALAASWMKQHFAPVLMGSRILSQDEALREMDLSTSAGYPWSLKYPNKRAFCDNQQSHSALEAYWDELGAEHEPAPVPIWTCSQKRELRSLTKIAENSLRVFTASPIEHTVASNRLYGDQNNKFYDAALDDIDSFVGASKFLGGWDRLFRKLTDVTEEERYHCFRANGVATDASTFDASLFRAIFHEIADLRWSCLRTEDRADPANRRRHERTYHHIVHSVVVLEGPAHAAPLVRKNTGNPSGSGNTIGDNTLAIWLQNAYAFIIAARRRGVSVNYVFYQEHVRKMFNGDDFLATVSETIKEWYHPRAIAEILATIGITITGQDQFKPLDELDFLSNHFEWDAALGIWLPRPATERVLGSLMWGSDMDDVAWHFYRACMLRIDSYGNEECRRIIAHYLEWLRSNYAEQLRHRTISRPEGGIPVQLILRSFKPDEWIEALYCGAEALSSRPLSPEDSEWLNLVMMHGEEELVRPQLLFKSHPIELRTTNLNARTLQSRITMATSKKKLSRRQRAALRSAAGSKKKKVAIVAVANPRSTLSGRGDYKWKIGGVPAGQAVGSAVGSLFGGAGSAVGRALGGAAHWTLKKIFGVGDYHVGDFRDRSRALNSHYSSHGDAKSFSESVLLRGDVPVFSGAFNGTRIVYHERIGTVTSSTDFHSQNFIINPGNATTFPWAHTIARRFEQYKLRGMAVEYRSLAGELATGAIGLGAVAIATQYDPHAGPFTSLAQAENSIFTTVRKPNESFMHLIECAPSRQVSTVKYVRTATELENDADAALSNVGTFQVITQGNAAAGQMLGEVWVTYSLELINPSLVNQNDSIGALWTRTLPTGGGNWSDWKATSASALPLKVSSPANFGPSATTVQVNMPKIAGFYLAVYSAHMPGATISGSVGPTTFSTDVVPSNDLPNSGAITGDRFVSVFAFEYKAQLAADAPDLTYINFTTSTSVPGSIRLCIVPLPAISRVALSSVAARVAREVETQLSDIRAALRAAGISDAAPLLKPIHLDVEYEEHTRSDGFVECDVEQHVVPASSPPPRRGPTLSPAFPGRF